MWDSARVGINTPPIKIRLLDHPKYKEALFMLYHGADKKNTFQLFV